MTAGKPGASRECPASGDRDSPAEVRGHRKALGDLARDHHRALLRFLRARTGSKEEAHEVAQEAYAKMLALDRPETVGFLEGYLWKIAGNLAIDRQRRQATKARLDPVLLYELEDLAPSPESLLDTQQRLELLEEAIDTLPPNVLEAFILRVLDGHSFSEVAARMNVSTRWAMSLVAQALKSCQVYLDAADASRRMTK